MKTRERKGKGGERKRSPQNAKAEATSGKAEATLSEAMAFSFGIELESVCECAHKRLFHVNDLECENCNCRLFRENKPNKKAAAAVWGTGSGYSQAWHNKPACNHTGSAPLVTFENQNGSGTIAGAAAMRLVSAGASLVIDCSGTYKAPVTRFVGSAPKLEGSNFEALNQYCFAPVPVLSLNWTDHAAPAVGFAFWLDLLSMLPAGKVIVCCIGSHGRTGTFLACVLVTKGMKAREAIEYVRANHCSQSIETSEQERYIEALAKWYGRD
jgi:hypothetical protein